jgi:anthranilate synthase component II
MKVLLIDNFDSFTYNLYQYLGELTEKVSVVRNDNIPFDDMERGHYSHIVISPGPGNPTDPKYFGGCRQVIEDYYQSIPILGICLGHQGIGAVFGATVIKAPIIMHGKTSEFRHGGGGLLKKLPSEITVMRYHSLVIKEDTLPPDFVIDAKATDGSVMAFHHRRHPLFGLQFHPESFGTPEGMQMLKNFLKTVAH